MAQMKKKTHMISICWRSKLIAITILTRATSVHAGFQLHLGNQYPIIDVSPSCAKTLCPSYIPSQLHRTTRSIERCVKKVNDFVPQSKSKMTSSTSLGYAWSDAFGSSVLSQVENLAAVVTRANDDKEIESTSNLASMDGSVALLSSRLNPLVEEGTAVDSVRSDKNGSSNRKVVMSALEKLERDMELLDNIAGQRSQLSTLELSLLSLSVLAASSGPLFFSSIPKVSGVLPPAAAAFSAAIGIGAEFTGRVAICDGKEIAAKTIQCAAEAESLLANAERVKAITPLCVGIGASAASISLLAPVLVESIFGAAKATGATLPVVTELYLLSPLVAVLAASVASLALQETRVFASQAISIGNRRFAKSGLVGRTWLSTGEQIEKKSISTSLRWRSFASSVLPAPLIGVFVPGMLSTKAIVIAACAAAQSAYFLAQAENVIARATDAVALKTRSAAVCDTYANQGSRSSAILPFTSALSGLCAAATAAVVELPLYDAVGSIGGVGAVLGQTILVTIFPALSSLFAAAASVSKARCEVDAEAAILASVTLALEYDDEDDPVLRPFRGVAELIRVTAKAGWKSVKEKTRSLNGFLLVLRLSMNKLFTLKRRNEHLGKEKRRLDDARAKKETQI